jgi:ABC-type transport system involved in Fe-S cluster assembly fused permease/ATPase subunit
MDRMFTLLAPGPRSGRRAGCAAVAVNGAAGAFENVASLRGQAPILNDVDFTIAGGTTTAVVGHSGSGKSTLARLLFRFYDVNRAGGHPDRRPGHPRRHAGFAAPAIGIVPQDTVLFNDRSTTTSPMAAPTATREEVIAAARAAIFTTSSRACRRATTRRWASAG